MDSFNSPGEIIEFTTQYYIYTSSFIFLSGLIGNTINLLIFTQIKSFRDDRSAFYLRMETISNLIRQTYIIIFSILLLLNDNDVTRYTNVTCRVHYFFNDLLSIGRSFFISNKSILYIELELLFVICFDINLD